MRSGAVVVSIALGREKDSLVRFLSGLLREKVSEKTTKQNATKRFLITFTHTSDDDDDDAFTQVTWTEQQTKVSPRYRRQPIEIPGVSSQISQKMFKCLLIAIFSLESKRGRNSKQKKKKDKRIIDVFRVVVRRRSSSNSFGTSSSSKS
jgi:hypothetical protein